MKKRVLFICTHNSARSQMAEAFLKELFPDRFEAFSAGTEPGVLNPYVIKAMKEIGIDISHNTTKSVKEFIKSGIISFIPSFARLIIDSALTIEVNSLL